MRFINGLKELFKKPLLAIIFVSFICLWVLFFVNFQNPELNMGFIVLLLVGCLASFTFIILVLTIFVPVEKIGIVLIIISIILIPLTLLFGFFIAIFYLFCYFANVVITAFFMFKFCMDTSISIDKPLYNSKNKTFYRIIEFFSLFILCGALIFFAFRLLFNIASNVSLKFENLVIIIYSGVFLTFVILTVVVLFTLIILQKFAAYFPLFYIFVVLYTSYSILSIFTEFRYIQDPTYNTVSFIIDLVIFIYIISSIFDRVEYIHDHIKIIRADTIAVFIILMKMIVQIVNIMFEANIENDPQSYLDQSIGQALGVLWFFMIITLIIGIFQILFYKHGKKK